MRGKFRQGFQLRETRILSNKLQDAGALRSCGSQNGARRGPSQHAQQVFGDNEIGTALTEFVVALSRTQELAICIQDACVGGLVPQNKSLVIGLVFDLFHHAPGFVYRAV
eukprot:scaffold40627_cov130-Amphora_coffeaeformis.AAC.1